MIQFTAINRKFILSKPYAINRNVADAMDLESDETAWRHIIDKFRARLTIDPGVDLVALAFDAYVVPFPHFPDFLTFFTKILSGFLVVLHGINPATTALIINPTGPPAISALIF